MKLESLKAIYIYTIIKYLISIQKNLERELNLVVVYIRIYLENRKRNSQYFQRIFDLADKIGNILWSDLRNQSHVSINEN